LARCHRAAQRRRASRRGRANRVGGGRHGLPRSEWSVWRAAVVGAHINLEPATIARKHATAKIQ
jgi:hypothetical protein